MSICCNSWTGKWTGRNLLDADGNSSGTSIIVIFLPNNQINIEQFGLMLKNSLLEQN